ncbi:MAG: hypothetical protein COA53_09020 [Rhodobacteraceae bacterium]|nr:MAG: hypothetical protein COA53_09020 [Paracoccaceae bacterium]
MNESAFPKRTVLTEIKSVLPIGTIDPKSLKIYNTVMDSPAGAWDLAPDFPPNLFAVVGHLCQISGAMGYYVPNPHDQEQNGTFVLSVKDKEELEKTANDWNSDAKNPTGTIDRLWADLLKMGNHDVRMEGSNTPQWWPVAMKLLIIADSASKGLGRHVSASNGEGASRFNMFIATFFDNNEGQKKEAESFRDQSLRKPASVTTLVDMDVVCVLPKSRIAQVGCTLRNLTANLALLPPRGMVRCHWTQSREEPKPDNHSALDILLVPLPYKIFGRNFHEKHQKSSITGKSVQNMPNWASFQINQGWLEDKEEKLVDFVMDLLKEASKEVETINGIIFPEFSLNYNIFEKLCDRLVSKDYGVEFIVAGSSTNCKPEEGGANFVVTAVRRQLAKPKNTDDQNYGFAITSRRKHHRWKLDQIQVSEYALASSLNPTTSAWWEDHHIAKRELYFHQFRQSSTFVSMICEDLARNDPCHEIIRSIGPNLLFALLMDGPQLKNRWSARYASSLADDPGCSVLTLTSFGLVDRLNSTKKYEENRSIALWKDETGQMIEIPMPKGGADCGVLISLCSKDVFDQTIDGRKTMNCSWRFQSQLPIEL